MQNQAPNGHRIAQYIGFLEASASQAIDQQKAQNWWISYAPTQRLFFVRHLHSNSSDAFSLMEDDLAKNDLSATLETSKSLLPKHKMF